MADQPPFRGQSRPETPKGQQQTRQQNGYEQPPAREEAQSNPDPTFSQEIEQAPAIFTKSKPETDKKAGFEAGDKVAVVGRAGERNLNVEWIDVWVGGCRSVRFSVKTAAENSIEVEVVQEAYKKMYQGNGTVNTQVMPEAPLGTKGKLIARDTTTGESLEQPWTWISLGGRSQGGPGLWEKMKRLLWNSGNP